MIATAPGCMKGIARFMKSFSLIHGVRKDRSLLRRFTHIFGVKECGGLICRRCQCNIRLVSIPVRVALLTPQFTVCNISTGTGKLDAAHDLLVAEEVSDEALDKLFVAINTDPESYRDVGSSYVEKLCKAGNFSALAKLLQVLRENCISLSPNAYNIVLSMAAEANDVELLFQTLKDMLVSDCADSDSYVSTSEAFAKINDSLPLSRFVQDVVELAPSTAVTFLNRLIYSLAGHGQVDKALLIYDNMKSLVCKPDLVTYNTVLGISGRTGRVDEMILEFSCMKDSGILPDLISFNTLINSLKKVGRLDLCLKYLKEMTESGLEPDLRTYTALIESFGRMGNVEESVRLFDEMKLRQIRPSIYVYRSLIDNLKKAGMVDMAVKYLEEMKLNYEHLVGPKDFKRKRK